ncbi:MAG: hypothetical protein JWR69_2002 [Pedosphaera sp.]|nr:hypothetical protein [Pedosphaera sp.]
MNYLSNSHYAVAGSFGNGIVALQSTGVPPLHLLRRAANEVTISWPATENSFGLEVVDPLSSPARWTPLAVGPQNELTVRLGMGNRYYRLKRKSA